MGAFASMLGFQTASAEQVTHKPFHISLTARDLDSLTRTIWGEARGATTRAELAVAHTVFNRVRSNHPMFKGDTSVHKACCRAGQFSSWLSRALHRIGKHDHEYEICESIARSAVVIYNAGQDYSRGATNFETRGARAYWAKHAEHVAHYDHLDFYRLKGT